MKKNLKNLLILLVVAALFLANQAGLLGGTEPAPEPVRETVQLVELPQAQPTAAQAPKPTAAAPPETAAPQTQPEETAAPETEAAAPEELTVEESGEYSARDEVALYIHQFGHLPKNYITKDKAQNLGWVSSQGNLWKVAPGKSIGGDYFGNYEGALPKAKGRKYYECDIDFDGKYRNAKRILFSNDGLIFYTDDHYETFTQLYGEGK